MSNAFAFYTTLLDMAMHINILKATKHSFLNTTVEFKSEQAKTFWNDLINIGYTVEIIKFAQKWAQHMQEELKKGNIIHDIAEKSACKVAKGKDIPVYMHYCAMVILSDVWKYGDELQSWYSHKCSNYYGEPIKLGTC